MRTSPKTIFEFFNNYKCLSILFYVFFHKISFKQLVFFTKSGEFFDIINKKIIFFVFSNKSGVYL